VKKKLDRFTGGMKFFGKRKGGDMKSPPHFDMAVRSGLDA
jgi:hypothetical protein